MIYCIDHNNILFQTPYEFNSGSILSGIPKECQQMSERPLFPPSWRKATWPQLMQKNSWSSLRLYVGFRVKHGLDEEQFDQTGKGHGYEKWDTCLNQGLWLLWWILKYCYCLNENIVHGTMNHIVYCLLSLYIVTADNSGRCSSIQSTLLQADTLGNWKKCSLLELSAYENYSHKRPLEKNRVDGRLQGD